MKKRRASGEGKAAVIRGEAAAHKGPSGGDVSPPPSSPCACPCDQPEHARLEAELRRAQRLAAIGHATSAIVHDFNNLLTGIVGCADLALQQLDPDLEGRWFVAELRAIALRGGMLTARLLDLDRAQDREPLPTDLDAVVRRTEPLLRGLLGEQVALTIASPRRHLFVRMHPVEIEQVLLNLAMNARRAMPRGGKLRVEISTTELNPREMGPMRPSPSRRFALIEVSDNGVGMDAETRARAFEPYFSGSLLTLGSGLGLATVREILGRRGGAIDLWSKVGLGTTVRMLLPIEVTAPSVEVETAPRPAVARTVEARESPVERGLTVLLVEDDEACRMAFATFLKRCGHRVLAAETAEEARGMWAHAAAPLDVVIADLGLAAEAGDDLAEAVRKAHPRAVVVLVSGREPESPRVKKALRGPRTAFLKKPFELEELIRTIGMLRAESRPGKSKGGGGQREAER